MRASGLDAGHGRRVVLRGVDLDVRAGDRLFLLGANASGKSTLLHTLLRVLPPLRGTVEWGDGLARAEIGYVPQRCELVANLPTTAHELVSLGLVGVDVSRAGREERVRDALAQVGLAGLERAGWASLSGGQRQRVLVARALARRPRLLAVDEPMNNLDVESQRALLDLLEREHRDAGLTLLFVTHDAALAERFATHVARVGDGGVQAGTRDELLSARRPAGTRGATG